MSNPVSTRARAAPTPDGELPCRVRLADGRTFSGPLPPARHQSLQLGLLHAGSQGLVEIAAGIRSEGNLMINTRTRADHFLPGGQTGREDWLEALLALIRRHAERGEEIFAGPAVRAEARGDKHAVSHTQALWVDVDQPGQLHRLWAFLAERPCHLLVLSGGSGGVHAYWRLAQPLPATRVIESTGELLEPIERAHLRLIHRLGVDRDGKPNVADCNCKDRSRVMRLAGTVNGKTGAYAQILEADFALPDYPIEQLVGDLPDPIPVRSTTDPSRRQTIEHRDPYKRIPPPEYFEQLAGIDVPARGGLVSCPAPWHLDTHASCSVGADATQGWCCLAGETRVITVDGVHPIGDLSGSTRRILTTGGVWRDAPFRSFGTQNLWRIVVTRNGREKDLLATAEHRWFVRTKLSRPRREVRTRELVPGQGLVPVFPNRTPRACRLNVSPFGVARGFTFGDGHRFRQGSRASFYGSKDAALLPYFPVARPYHHAPTGSLVIGDLPGYFKELPDINELPSYLYGWLAGYFAADGDINHGAQLHCANVQILERVRTLCTRIGACTYGIARYERVGIDGAVSPIYRLPFLQRDLTPEFFVLPHHRQAFERNGAMRELRGWVVKHVERTSRTEEVFCATVPGTHAFALEDNILTGNCHACGARGAIYDLASVLLGGPYGRELRGEQFKRAREYIADIFGEQT